ncbi:MAG: hypothetical protein KDB82_15530 [Planctomycetes bacterium]|nr:hypothetical protein [Planctomycetota bacterium]
MKKTRAERLAICFERLATAPPADSYEAALKLVCDTLDQVEDEFSGEPNDPSRWMELDRMFPPLADNLFPDTPRKGVTTAVTRGHNILIGSNGSVEIHRRVKTDKEKTTILEMSKPGADGRGLP